MPGSSKCLLDSFRLLLLVLPMQMHKVATYAQAKLLEQHIGVALRPVYIKRPTGSAAGTAPPPEQLLPPTHVDPATGNLIPWQGNVQELELTCNGLVSWPVNVQQSTRKARGLLPLVNKHPMRASRSKGRQGGCIRTGGY